MENLDALLAILHSSNLLLSAQGVQQPCEDPSVDSSSISRTQRVPPVHFGITQCPPGRVSRILSDSCFLRTPSRVLPLCTPCTGSMPTWQSCQESSDDSDFLRTHSRVLLCALLALAQCPPGRVVQNSQRVFVFF
jgi:hypothetical protein